MLVKFIFFLFFLNCNFSQISAMEENSIIEGMGSLSLRHNSRVKKIVYFPTAQELSTLLKDIGFDQKQCAIGDVSFDISVPKFLKQTDKHSERKQILSTQVEPNDYNFLTRSHIPDHLIRIMLIDWSDGGQTLKAVYGIKGLLFDNKNFIFLDLYSNEKIVDPSTFKPVREGSNMITPDLKIFLDRNLGHWFKLYHLPIANPTRVPIYAYHP